MLNEHNSISLPLNKKKAKKLDFLTLEIAIKKDKRGLEVKQIPNRQLKLWNKPSRSQWKG